jgi:hypothetical protein
MNIQIYSRYRAFKKKEWIGISTFSNNKSFYMKNITIWNIYDKIHTVDYYSGCYSSLRDKILANVVILDFHQKMEKNDNIANVAMPTLFMDTH